MIIVIHERKSSGLVEWGGGGGKCWNFLFFLFCFVLEWVVKWPKCMQSSLDSRKILVEAFTWATRTNGVGKFCDVLFYFRKTNRLCDSMQPLSNHNKQHKRKFALIWALFSLCNLGSS